LSVRAAIEHFARAARSKRHMSSSTLFTMVLVGAGSGALALATVRALVLMFPRARGPA